MARTHLQRRWRARTDRKRIEIYLPADKVDALDALANARGESRAGVIETLIADASASPDHGSDDSA